MPKKEFEKTKLANGVEVVTNAMSGRASVAIGIWVRSGGRYENLQNKGIAHFLEHLLFKGSKKYSCRQLKEAIEGRGGSLNGFTAEEMTCYLTKIPSRYLDLGLDVLSDMVLNPLLEDEEIAKEKTVIIEEIKMYKDLPQSHVHELLDELLWPGQPLGVSLAGSVETVSAINQEALSKFQKEFYTCSNIVVSVAGALKHKDVVKKAKEAFGTLKKSKRNSFVPATVDQKEPQLKILNKDTEQTHLAMGYHAIAREHPLRHAATLLNIVLGGNMSSRLFDEMREKRGLAYEIGAGIRRFYDTGVFIVHAGIDNSKVEEALEIILTELSKIKKELVSEGEFKRAKDFYLGQLALALEDTSDNMLLLGEALTAGEKIHTYRNLCSQVNRVRRPDICEAAKLFFKEEKLNLALIGPLAEKETRIKSCLKLS